MTIGASPGAELIAAVDGFALALPACFARNPALTVRIYTYHAPRRVENALDVILNIAR